jgi:flavin-dependent dehydrogenase
LQSCDVVVVGGGPAGSTCAWALRRAGLEVLLLDRARFPRDKPCAGWLTPQAVAALQLDLADYARHCVLQPVTGVKASRMDGPEVVTRYPEAVSYGVRRCEFDHYLLRRAGVGVRAVSTLRLRRDADAFVVDDSIRTPLVVGAGGHFCPVARALGAGPGEKPVVVAQEIELRLGDEQRRACPVQGETPELFFCKDLEGYGWAFRKGDYLNVGFGRRDPRDFPAQLRDFTRSLVARGRVPRGLPRRWPGHAYLVYEGPGRRLIEDGVLLVGDAAGLAYPQSGEGIGPAIESALLASAAIVAARGDYARERLEPYRRSLEARLGPRQRRDPLRAIPGPLRTWLGGRVLATPRWNRKLVVDRWFLHRQQPPLASLPAQVETAPA